MNFNDFLKERWESDLECMQYHISYEMFVHMLNLEYKVRLYWDVDGKTPIERPIAMKSIIFAIFNDEDITYTLDTDDSRGMKKQFTLHTDIDEFNCIYRSLAITCLETKMVTLLEFDTITLKVISAAFHKNGKTEKIKF